MSLCIFKISHLNDSLKGGYTQLIRFYKLCLKIPLLNRILKREKKSMFYYKNPLEISRVLLRNCYSANI